MPDFRWQGISPRGQVLHGVLDASSREAVLQSLRSRCIEPIPSQHLFRSLLLKRAPTREIEAEAVRLGMSTLRQSALNKLKAGQTTIEEVLRATPARA